MFGRTDIEIIARHHLAERRSEATSTRRTRAFTRRDRQDFIATPRRQ